MLVGSAPTSMGEVVFESENGVSMLSHHLHGYKAEIVNKTSGN